MPVTPGYKNLKHMRHTKKNNSNMCEISNKNLVNIKSKGACHVEVMKTT